MTGPSFDVAELRQRLEALVSTGDLDTLGRAVADLHPSDLADLLEQLDEQAQVQVLSALPAQLASESLVEMEEGHERGDLLAALKPTKGAELIRELADDDAVDLIAELEPHEQQAIFGELPAEEAGDLRGLLQYDEDTAGGLMTTELVAVEVSLTAREALDRVRVLGREVEDFYTVFVVDEHEKLLGTVRLDDLITAEPDDLVQALVEPVTASAHPDLDQEEVGRLIARYNLASIPVVNQLGELMGRITFDDVIDVIEAEQTEDLLRLVGVNDEEELRHNWVESVRTRLPWLLLNLLTAALAASVILAFADLVQTNPVLAFIAPIIAALGGSSGTQSLAITIRRITVEGPGASRSFVGKEILIGLVNGAALGVGITIVSFLVEGDLRLGLVVMLAMWGNQVVATFAGAFIPTTLDRIGVDPSVASSVFVHTLTDLCGFFLLLGLASRLLH
jgi:magnesium transporter